MAKKNTGRRKLSARQQQRRKNERKLLEIATQDRPKDPSKLMEWMRARHRAGTKDPNDFGAPFQGETEPRSAYRRRMEWREAAAVRAAKDDTTTGDPHLVESVLAECIVQTHNAMSAHEAGKQKQTADGVPRDEWTFKGMTEGESMRAVFDLSRLRFMAVHELMQGQHENTFTDKHKTCRRFLAAIYTVYPTQIEVAAVPPEQFRGDTPGLKAPGWIKLMLTCIARLHRILDDKTPQEFRLRLVEQFEDEHLERDETGAYVYKDLNPVDARTAAAQVDAADAENRVIEELETANHPGGMGETPPEDETGPRREWDAQFGR